MIFPPLISGFFVMKHLNSNEDTVWFVSWFQLVLMQNSTVIQTDINFVKIRSSRPFLSGKSLQKSAKILDCGKTGEILNHLVIKRYVFTKISVHYDLDFMLSLSIKMISTIKMQICTHSLKTYCKQDQMNLDL